MVLVLAIYHVDGGFVDCRTALHAGDGVFRRRVGGMGTVPRISALPASDVAAKAVSFG